MVIELVLLGALDSPKYVPPPPPKQNQRRHSFLDGLLMGGEVPRVWIGSGGDIILEQTRDADPEAVSDGSTESVGSSPNSSSRTDIPLASESTVPSSVYSHEQELAPPANRATLPVSMQSLPHTKDDSVGDASVTSTVHAVQLPTDTDYQVPAIRQRTKSTPASKAVTPSEGLLRQRAMSISGGKDQLSAASKKFFGRLRFWKVHAPR